MPYYSTSLVFGEGLAVPMLIIAEFIYLSVDFLFQSVSFWFFAITTCHMTIPPVCVCICIHMYNHMSHDNATSARMYVQSCHMTMPPLCMYLLSHVT